MILCHFQIVSENETLFFLWTTVSKNISFLVFKILLIRSIFLNKCTCVIVCVQSVKLISEWFECCLWVKSFSSDFHLTSDIRHRQRTQMSIYLLQSERLCCTPAEKPSPRQWWDQRVFNTITLWFSFQMCINLYQSIFKYVRLMFHEFFSRGLDSLPLTFTDPERDLCVFTFLNSLKCRLIRSWIAAWAVTEPGTWSERHTQPAVWRGVTLYCSLLPVLTCPVFQPPPPAPGPRQWWLSLRNAPAVYVILKEVSWRL